MLLAHSTMAFFATDEHGCENGNGDGDDCFLPPVFADGYDAAGRKAPAFPLRPPGYEGQVAEASEGRRKCYSHGACPA